MGSVLGIRRRVVLALLLAASNECAWIHPPGFQHTYLRQPVLASTTKFGGVCRESAHGRRRLTQQKHQPRMESSGDSSVRLFIFGLGYTGTALARAARESMGGAVAVSGTYRSRRPDLDNLEIAAFHFDSSQDGEALSDVGWETLRAATHVVSTMPPDRESGLDPVLQICGEELRRKAGSDGLWAGYLSTTSVYGDHQGAWVDESSETRVSLTDSAARRLETEQAWLELAEHGVDAHVFRLSGIYGPGRSMIDSLRSSGAASAAAEAGPSKFVSRIHVADMAQVVLASMRRPSRRSIYNVADDRPAPRSEVEQFALQLLRDNSEDVKESASQTQTQDADGVAGIRFEPEVPTAGPKGPNAGVQVPRDGVEVPRNAGGGARKGSARSRRTDNKRVSNRKIKEELAVVLRYPDYVSGLQAVLREST